MRYYFRNKKGELKCVEGDIPCLIQYQARVRTFINANTNQKSPPVLPILAVIDGDKDG